jgi:hypothetical protein
MANPWSQWTVAKKYSHSSFKPIQDQPALFTIISAD